MGSQRVLTISTHNGWRANRKHNVRDPKVVQNQKHIDPQGHHEVWYDEDPKVAYERLFGKAVEKYNETQTRKDRKIKDYYRQVSTSKTQHPVYEMIIAIGNSRGNMIDPVQGKEILKEFVESWSLRNPNLHLCGAYYHADEEGVPHVHCDYIPVARGCQRGPEVQTGLVKALQGQGFKYVNTHCTEQVQWQQSERDHLEMLCVKRGHVIIHPQTRRHLETQLYKSKSALRDVANKYGKIKKAIGMSVGIVADMEHEFENTIDHSISR